MTRFRSKLDGMNRRHQAWLCLSCRAISLVKIKVCPNCDGEMHHFPSKKELTRAIVLLLRVRATQIHELRFHPRYDLIVKGRHVTTYVADAAYVEDALPIVEDTKPLNWMDGEAKLKIALFEACYAPLKVRIV